MGTALEDKPDSKRGEHTPSAFRRFWPRKPKHSFPRRRHRWPFVVLAVVVLIGGVGAYLMYEYRRLEENTKVRVPPVTPEPKGRPFNALLVGSDSRVGLTEQEQLELGANSVGGGERADTLIVAHVDPRTDHVTMVQFPRDLWVPVAGMGKNKINTGLVLGKSNLVQTVENLTGLNINRYVQVNIAGFRDLVDAIGGVEICIPEPIPFDPNTGIEVKHPGMVHFDGDRALRFVRARHVFASGDFARIQNQQKFLAAAIDKVTSVSTFFNPGRIRKLLDVAGRNLRLDDKTSPLDAYRLAQRFRAFNPDDYEAYTAPNLGTAFVGDASVVLPDRRAMSLMFRAIANNESPAEADGVPNISPAEIRVGIYNGTSELGAGAAAASQLRSATQTAAGSIYVAEVASAKRQNYTNTVVRYTPVDPRAEKKAKLVAAAIPGARVEVGRTKPNVDVAVVVGANFKTKDIVQIVPIPIPQPGTLPPACRR